MEPAIEVRNLLADDATLFVHKMNGPDICDRRRVIADATGHVVASLMLAKAQGYVACPRCLGGFEPPTLAA